MICRIGRKAISARRVAAACALALTVGCRQGSAPAAEPAGSSAASGISREDAPAKPSAPASASAALAPASNPTSLSDASVAAARPSGDPPSTGGGSSEATSAGLPATGADGAAAPAAAKACDPQRDCCRTDTDCVALDKVNPCECPPCGEQKRWALNRSGAERHRAKWARRRCVRRACPPCSGSYIGTAVCLAGRCAIR